SQSNSDKESNGALATPVPKPLSKIDGMDVISVDASESPNVSGKIQINNLTIDTDRIIGHGSAGTCVFEGKFEGRAVAVKRMLSQYYELASQEVSFLQQSDHDKNVIRYYCQQKDQHFLYIAVELCQASLWDLFNLPDVRDEARYQQLQSLASAVQRDVRGTLYQLAKGLYHLHDLRIIHRDIKPQNILIAFPKPNKPNELRLVISDFGLCKTLPENVSTLIDPTSNAGTCGWKAPELISQPKDTASNNGHSNISHPGTSESSSGGTMGGVKRAADIFSLGCLFFWVLTGGDHPYDDKEGWMQMRELNIKKNNLQNMHKLDLGSDSEEPRQLITAMLAHNPEDRPSAQQVLCHPFFWSPKKRLDFLCDVSDHFEHEPRDPPS
ncbi:kinase-like protein, partial [Aureobasidium melanogenum]